MIQQKQLRIEYRYFADYRHEYFFCADEVWNYFNKPMSYETRTYFLVASDEPVDDAVKIILTKYGQRSVGRCGPILLNVVTGWLRDVGFADTKPVWIWMEYE